jgi:hypothetical protein
LQRVVPEAMKPRNIPIGLATQQEKLVAAETHVNIAAA